MHPHELVAALIRRTGKSLPQIARDMGHKGFQPTLHKIAHGQVKSPTRASADRIARFFDIPVDALYDSKVARRIAAERGLLPYQADMPAAPFAAKEPEVQYRITPTPNELPSALVARIAALPKPAFDDVVKTLEALVTGLEAQARLRSKAVKA